MKKIILLIVMLCSISLLAQEKNIKKPEYVIVANNEIITNEMLEELGQKGLIKGMNKGVTEEERNILFEKFGDKIGDSEFIIKIDVLTENEKAALDNKVSTENKVISQEEENNLELKLNVNETATNFTVEMINGEKINLSNLKGKVVLLNFWTTWCAPCLMEFSEFPKKILEPFKDENFILIAVSIGESKEKVQKKMDKMKKHGVNFNVGIDPNKEIWDKYATGTIPKSFLIDQNGIIKYISVGNAEGNVDNLATEISKLIVE